jgi:hypothetical protein
MAAPKGDKPQNVICAPKASRGEDEPQHKAE